MALGDPFNAKIFETALINIEGILNRRPLTALSPAADDCEPLTPIITTPATTMTAARTIPSSTLSILIDASKEFMRLNVNVENTKKPQKFTVVHMRPIEVHAKLGTQPKKDRLRRATDVKEPFILEHLEKLQHEGVIKEAQDLSSGYLSNVVLVLESRYVASKGREVKKSRFFLDYRKVNHDISMTHWHLPNMDDFRRQMSSGEFKVFTNLDCSQFYYQLKISKRSGKLFSGFWAANKLWIWLRLPMGLSLSGSWGQFWMDQAFKEHHHTRPFMDDISIFSIDLSEMLDSDLPLCLDHHSRQKGKMKSYHSLNSGPGRQWC